MQGAKPAPILKAAPPGSGFFVVRSRNGTTPRAARETPMETPMSHKFSLRQLVRLTRPGYSDKNSSSSGIYEVTRLMPADETGEVSYRIKASGAGERAVRESEITARVS